ncbi:lipopolysaccharide heptosyltransferase II [Accumulibacter sp.]|uniref:lipopolysaccharide heptosyltransferase II n=1 Tax=Accumulibacter sp. TaxID=2053492 RepID=UPI0025FDACC7|nr:lipopolysaccharide heptosyltransferase II [Accumulibacter sp.]MCM8610771.1 lipopolysaccharide heptosyltransferase II [Accumulibacter sp.]MCM8634918.1 lipopolysaccharide heptosyltransferase II [Accumulibacter sp.]MCM8638563.1 lipopolysaccharide heptosyltransferase II [Accumulibacter sp.]
MKALVVAPSWIGDSVLAQPLFTRLHERTPGLQLDALAPRWVAPVLERMPEINRIVDSPFAHGELSLRTRHRIARELAREGYQRAYVLPNSLKSALIPFFADIPERIGFIGETRYGLINRRHTLDKKLLPQMAERFAQLAEEPAAPLPRPLPQPRLRTSPAQRIETLAALGVSLPAKLAVFCPGAEYGPAKRWPARHFAALAAALAQRGHAVWLLGSTKDRAVGEEILEHASPGSLPLNLCGTTTLAQAIDLIGAASLVVCNDSGLMHVAAALGRRVVAVYGSSSPDFTPPLSATATIISLNLACSPCFKRQCPLGHLDCLQQIEPERVLAACLGGVAA